MQKPPHSMDGVRPSPLPDRFSSNGLHDATSSGSELVYSSEESPRYANLREHDSQVYQTIEPSPSGSKDNVDTLVREKGPTYIMFEGRAPCEAPVMLEPGEKLKAAVKVRSFFKKATSKRSRNIEFCPDPYVGSSNVAALHSNTFTKFLKQLDVVFVLFYNPFDDNCRWAKLNMKKAALATEREMHAYAAVDCTKECQLCKTQGIKSFPTMKLYSRGKLVNTYGSETVLLDSEMKTFVEQAPVTNQQGCRTDCVIQ